jgi:hypothetical protein
MLKETHIADVAAQQNVEDCFRVLCWGVVLTAANWRFKYAKGLLKSTQSLLCFGNEFINRIGKMLLA